MPTATKKAETRYKDVDELMAIINKKHGPGTMVKASEMPIYDRITTGSLSFDVMLGGGWPVNQAHEIVGEFSSGKTALCYQTAAANQAADPDYLVLVIAAEAFDKVWAEQCGMVLDRTIIAEINNMEEAWQTVLDFMDNRAVDLIIVDSLPALIPGDEDDKQMDEMTVGRGALLNNKFFRKAGKSLKRSLLEKERACTLLVINQWREKIGVMKGDPRTTPGGKGKDFAYFTRVSMRRTDWIEQSQETVGIEITAVTIKNKSAPNRRTATVDFYFDGLMAGGFDTVKDMVNTAMYMGVIKRAGAYYRFQDEQWQGKDGVFQAVREDLDLQERIREQTLRVLGNVSTDPRDTDDEE